MTFLSISPFSTIKLHSSHLHLPNSYYSYRYSYNVVITAALPLTSSSPDLQKASESAIKRISDKVRQLRYVDSDPNPKESESDPAAVTAGEIFIPTPLDIPIYQVGSTIDSDPPKIETLPSVAELTLPSEELRRLRTLGIRLREKLRVGKAGITEGIVNGIHERWRRSEVVKIKCNHLCRINMKRTHQILERKTGGLVVWRSGSVIILYRGSHYKYPYFKQSDQVVTDSDMSDGLNDTPTRPALVPGLGSQNTVRLQLPGEAKLAKEADRLLDGLGLPFLDWWGLDPKPVDADLLPGVVIGFRKPFRILPFGIKQNLTYSEMTTLRRLGRPLSCHFALGRNRSLQGLTQAMTKLWEKCEITKIAAKRGVQNTDAEIIAEELKKLTGGTLLSRDSEYIVFYRGKDFLPLAVSTAIEDLVQRSMVYVKSRSYDGSVEVCCIHDLLRDLAIQKAKEDKFLVVYSHPDDQQFMSGARRVAVHNLDCDEHMLSQNLRTLLYFGNKYMPNCSNQRLLKVVSTGTSYDTKVKLEMFEGLTQLRYLDLTGQPNDKWEGCLEKVIGAMKFLQSFYFAFRDEGFIPIPDSLWHINTLRHVTAHNSCELPPSTKLTNLQTLPKLIVTKSWETELPHLPSLRSLKLVNNKSVSAESVVAFLGTLEHLITLEIEGDHIPLHIFDMRCLPFYQNLQSLRIYNTCETPHEIAIDVSMFPPHLTYLYISNYLFHQDVMSVLEKLPCLKVLHLYEVFTNKKLSCSAKGFNQLETLHLWFMTFEDWEIEDGAMPILRELAIRWCSKLSVIPQGLRHLTGLQKLRWVAEWGRTNGEILNLLKDVVPSNVEIDLD